MSKGPMARRIIELEEQLRHAEDTREQAEAELEMARAGVDLDNRRLRREVVALDATLDYAKGLLWSRSDGQLDERFLVDGFLEGYRKATCHG